MYNVETMKNFIKEKAISTKVDITSNELCSCCLNLNSFISDSKTNKIVDETFNDEIIIFENEVAEHAFYEKTSHLTEIHRYIEDYFTASFFLCNDCSRTIHLVTDDVYYERFTEQKVMSVHFIDEDSPSFDLMSRLVLAHHVLNDWKDKFFTNNNEVIALFKVLNDSPRWSLFEGSAFVEDIEKIYIKASDVIVYSSSVEHQGLGFERCFDLSFDERNVIERFTLTNVYNIDEDFEFFNPFFEIMKITEC